MCLSCLGVQIMIRRMAFKFLRAARVPERSVSDLRRAWNYTKNVRALGTDPCDLWRYHPQADYFLVRGGDTVAPPITANLALTNKCNLRCEICGSQKYLDQTETRRRHMAFHTVEAVAETIFPFLVTVELNSQGDPMLYPEITGVLNLVAQHGCELKVQTNGTLFTDRIIDLLMRQHGEVNLSLDAVGPKFDEVRQGGVWAKAEPGLKRFLAARDPKKLTVGIYPTVTRRTQGEALGVLDWAAAHDVDNVVFHRYSPIQGSFEERPSAIEIDALRESLAAWTARNNDQVRVYFEGLGLNSVEPRLRKTEFASEKHNFTALYAPLNYPIDADQPGADAHFTCTAPNSYAEIGLDGQLSACCRSQESPVGYATSVDAFAEAWFGRNYQRVRQSLRRGASGPYSLPNCEECMKFFAPKAAEGRHAVRYDAGSKPSADSLEFIAGGDFRIEGIGKDEGHCYFSDRLPPGVVPDFFDLWEDNRRLGPGGASPEEIRTAGAGRFLIAGRSIYWATSDNTDPRRNFRSYSLRPKTSSQA
jgi:MoaA/NifB/PqqE/SkfB family radical SAM enzyme